MDTKLVRITPPTARDWLKRNTMNRPVRPTKVEAMKVAFQRGEYMTTHQGIAFSTENVLLDGQHRLLAIAQMPDSFVVEMLVSRNVPPEAFDVIDTLATPRSAADVLKISAGCAAVARFIVVKLVDSARESGVTPTFLRPFVNAIEGPFSDLIDYCPTTSKTWSAASIRAAAILRVLSGGDRDYILLSYHALNHADYDAMSPIVKALNRQQARGTINSQSLDIFVRAFRAFDHRRQGVATIQISDQSHLLSEARAIVTRHILGQKKAPAGAGAKKVNSANSTRAVSA